MGYRVFMVDARFFIPAANRSRVLQAIARLSDKQADQNINGGHFAFVSAVPPADQDDLVQVLDAWRWIPECDDSGNIIELVFSGEKLGDDAVLFDAIAPFVQDGSYIQMVGEDGVVWRWLFRNGRVVRLEARVDFGIQ